MKIDLHLVLHLNNSCVRDTFTFQLFRDYSVISAVLMVQCVVEDGKSEHRVCIFKNIVLWEGQLLYVANGELVHVLVRKPCVSFAESHQG